MIGTHEQHLQILRLLESEEVSRNVVVNYLQWIEQGYSTTPETFNEWAAQEKVMIDAARGERGEVVDQILAGTYVVA
jgi:hypothetical protein